MKKIIDFFLFRTLISEKCLSLSFIVIITLITLDLIISFKTKFSLILQKNLLGSSELFLFCFGLVIIYRLILEKAIISFKLYSLGKQISKRLKIDLLKNLKNIDYVAIRSLKQSKFNFFRFDVFLTPLIVPFLFIVSLFFLSDILNVNNKKGIETYLLFIINYIPQEVQQFTAVKTLIVIIKILYVRVFFELHVVYVRTLQIGKIVLDQIKHKLI